MKKILKPFTKLCYIFKNGGVCAVNVQEILHFRTSGCVIKLVSLLRDMLEVRTRLSVLAVLIKCGKLVSSFTVYSIK
jgi:hypothetical protein